MPLNPCGAKVDFARRPYTTECRFFANSEETAQIVWYPAQDDAPALGHPTAFMSRDWDDDFWDLKGVGEVYGTPREWNAQTKIPGLGHHLCGTKEELVDGVEYDHAREHVVYNVYGIPECCGQIIPEIGGVALSGEGVVTYTPPGPAPGHDCPTATLIDLDTWYEWVSDPDYTKQQWWKFTLPAGPPFFYTVECEMVALNHTRAWTLHGNSCPPTTSNWRDDSGGITVNPIGEEWYVMWNTNSSNIGAWPYRFRIVVG